MHRLFLLLVFLLSIIPDVPAQRVFRTSAVPQEPTLLSPCSDKVFLKGKKMLGFRWDQTRPGFIRYTDFRLYRGYETSDDHLILKDKVDFQSSTAVAVQEFQAGQTYTWVIREVYLNGQKGIGVSCSFTVKEDSSKIQETNEKAIGTERNSKSKIPNPK